MISEDVLETDRLVLRTLMPEDVGQTYLDWMNDVEVTRYLESRLVVQSVESLRAFVETSVASPSAVLFGVFAKDGDRHIGNVRFSEFNPYHLSCSVGLLIGERAAWGKGYGQESLRAATDHILYERGMHAIHAGSYSGNPASLRTFVNCGFEIIGRFRQMVAAGGRWHDKVMMLRLNEAVAAPEEPILD